MNKSVSYVKTLFYYDAPMIFHSKDKIGCDYISLLVEDTKDTFRYLSVPISRQKLGDFNKGNFDLLDIFSNPETNEYYILDTDEVLSSEFEISLYEDRPLPEKWMPEAGFYLTDQQETDEEVLEQAKELQKPVFHASLNVPESKFDTKIDTERLSSFLTVFQNFIKHAYNKACKIKETYLPGLEPSDAHRLIVNGFGPGSFTIKFESMDSGNLFGGCGLESSFELLDKAFEKIENPAEVLKVLEQNRGHFVSSYIKLLEYLTANNASLSYKWATPAFNKINSKNLSNEKITPLLEYLTQVENLGSEQIQFKGPVIGANINKGSWTILNQEDKTEYSGKIKDGSDISLKGIVIGTKKYQFDCEEVMEQVLGTGKEKKTVYLLNYCQLN